MGGPYSKVDEENLNVDIEETTSLLNFHILYISREILAWFNFGEKAKTHYWRI